ncbi:helicase-related protein [Fibrobacter intestinalis]|uniref:PLD-like domain-containing protein n=1 Tax=Fibrobacter intestinalis TaxID=28122 RepID=A0A1T4LZG1_9BACT|nr:MULTISPECIES: helicase-related protein [Fibrobacter]PBC74816.1 phospholipase D-like protein [Fibrobacter sp. NR9]SJZ60037.1 PLD-like domain-containing protein [Fibrobacter intestinalis]
MPQFLLTTNETDKSKITFKERLQSLISKSRELRALVGYFYFSGVGPLHDAIRDNPDIRLKVLVGMEAEEHMGKIIEVAATHGGMVSQEYKEAFLGSLHNVFASKGVDDETFFERNKLFVDLLREGRLEIRKTREPNHAKMYLFTMKNDEVDWLTGSANLTWSALEKQNEVNVDLNSFDYDRASMLFGKWWDDAVPLTDDEEVKTRIIRILENESVLAPVTPFEAYAKVLKTIAEKEEIQEKTLDSRIAKVLEKAGYNNFKYQTDAVLSALHIVEKYNGVIIADVVGLGKSIVASLLGNLLTGSGLVLCPPSLVGDDNGKSGWKMYLQKFGLASRGWDARSAGILESDKFDEFMEFVDERNFDTIIVDEAHRFRNQDTDSYSKLWRICNGRKVILLTATPFNNSPADFGSLLQLFMDMGSANLCAGGDLQEKFQNLTMEFNAANYLLAHLPLMDKTQANECKKRWKSLFGEEYEKGDDFSDPSKCFRLRRKIVAEMKRISKEVREIIAPVTIRRNRIDIQKDPEYAKDVKEMSKVVPPKEQFYKLSKEQNEFYDRVINEYLSDVNFMGAAYRPYAYTHLGSSDEDFSDNVQQEGMYKFMRRLLVRRFESSFGAFEKTVQNAIGYYRLVKRIAVVKGIVFQSRKYLEKFSDLCENDASAEEFKDFFSWLNSIESAKTIRNKDEFYDATDKNFDKTKFLADLDKDIEIFERILKEIDSLNLLKNDPKALQLVDIIQKVLDGSHGELDSAPNRKVIVFTEYQDTIDHLKNYFEKSSLKKVVLIPDSIGDVVLQNFDFSSQKQEDKYKVLVVSDRFSEGLNLSRAGLVINYDIPWNPTRVIQRVGRINRIGCKIFNKLYIFNYFPTEQGCDIIHSKEIAANKMSMIYKILGEDAQVLTEEDDNPQPSKLFEKVNADPDDFEEMSPLTAIRMEWKKIQTMYPEIAEKVNNLPNRIKSVSVAKTEENVGFYVLKKKGPLLWCVFQNSNGERKLIHAVDFALRLKCKREEAGLPMDGDFWKLYKEIAELDPMCIERDSAHGMPKNDVYTKANKVIAEALNVAIPDSDIYAFLRIIQDDLQNWRTIPKYDLKILGKIPGNDPDAIYNKMLYLKEFLRALGDKRKDQRKASQENDEVVIGVEKK